MRQNVIEDSAVRLRQLAQGYLTAKSVVIEEGYATEIDWQYIVSLTELSEQILLRETAWVILCSGMRERTVRRKFANISRAFLSWESARAIVKQAEICKTKALNYFRHPAKISAIITVASFIDEHGFAKVVQKIEEDGITYLKQFPYIGPVTCFHLAKNIGFSVAKPDRHLSMLAAQLGYGSVEQLCKEIADATDEPVPVVDLVLWRYSTLSRHNVSELWEFAGSK
jgi:hypothetical protein